MVFLCFCCQNQYRDIMNMRSGKHYHIVIINLDIYIIFNPDDFLMIYKYIKLQALQIQGSGSDIRFVFTSCCL